MASKKLTQKQIKAGAALLESMANTFAAKVHPYYVVMRWQWAGGVTSGAAPSVSEIAETVRVLARKLVEDADTAAQEELTSMSAATGGVEVEVRTKFSSGDVTAEVRFVPVSSFLNSRL